MTSATRLGPHHKTPKSEDRAINNNYCLAIYTYPTISLCALSYLALCSFSLPPSIQSLRLNRISQTISQPHHNHNHWSTTIATMVLESGYPNTTGFRKVTKVTVLIKKKPGMSDEDFIEHYNHKHATMAAPVLLRHNVITYSLVSCFFPLISSSHPCP